MKSQFKKMIAILNVFVLLLNDPKFLPSGLALNANTRTGPYGISLSYVLGGGSNNAQNPAWAAYEKLPLTLHVPTREGYNFAGWYTDGSYRRKITKIDRDNAKHTVLFAKWTKEIDSYRSIERYSYRAKKHLRHQYKELRECQYRFLEDIKIPGMPSTREQDLQSKVISNDAQCLQGLCLTPDFILITAYAEDETADGSLLVFDRETGDYCMAINMKKQSHVGGIAYDGENVWVCHSNSKTLERIPYQMIVNLSAKAQGSRMDISAFTQEYPLQNQPSAIAYDNGKLWVATHRKWSGSAMISYRYDRKTDLLKPLSVCGIPSKVQGVAFDETGAVYLSTSYGRKSSSYLKVYDSLSALNSSPEHAAVNIEMPPCSEGVAMAGDSIYIVFESANLKYFEGTDGKGRSTSPIDKVLEISVASVW